MERPQFSLNDLFWCVTLISVGLGCFVLVFSVRIGLTQGAEWALFALSAGFGSMGAGLFAPFRRKRLGAYIGLVPVLVPIAFWLMYLAWFAFR